MKSDSNLCETNANQWPKSQNIQVSDTIASARTVVLFFLVGPPAGYLATVILAIFSGPWHDIGIGGIPKLFGNFLLISAIGLPLSYWIGGLQALLVGVISAAWLVKFKSLPMMVVLVATILVIGFMALLAPVLRQVIETTFNPFVLGTFKSKEDWPLIVVHFVASLSCWIVFKWISRNPQEMSR